MEQRIDRCQAAKGVILGQLLDVSHNILERPEYAFSLLLLIVAIPRIKLLIRVVVVK